MINDPLSSRTNPWINRCLIAIRFAFGSGMFAPFCTWLRGDAPKAVLVTVFCAFSQCRINRAAMGHPCGAHGVLRHDRAVQAGKCIGAGHFAEACGCLFFA
jgi:hypothetical protein